MQQVALLGHVVHACTRATFLAALAEAVAGGRKEIFANHNLHSLALYQQSKAMRAFYALPLRLIAIDGMPIIWWGWLLGRGLRPKHRVAFLDWQAEAFAMAAAQGWRVYYLGGRPGVAARAAVRLRQQHPGLQIETDHGFHTDQEGVLARLNAYAPQLLIVGMGMPRQEAWIVAHYDRLPACVITHQGAAFDYLAGEMRPAPRWLGRLGFEWLWRLCGRPRTYFRRYLLESWGLLPLMAADLRAALGAHFRGK